MNWKYILCMLISALFAQQTAMAQVKADTIYLSDLQDKIILESKPALKVHAYKSGMSWQQVKASNDWSVFDSNFLQSKTPSCWIKFHLQNDTRKPEYVLISHASSDSFQLFLDFRDSVRELLSGSYISGNQLQFYYDNVSNGFTLDSGQTVTVFAKVYNEHRHLFTHSFYLETREYYARSLAGEYINNSGNAQYHTLTIGALLFSALFIGLLGIWFKEKSFVYYILYIVGAILYLLPKVTSSSYVANQILKVNPQYLFFSEGLQFLFYAAYIAFGTSLVNASRYKQLYRYTRIVIGLFLLYALSIALYQSITKTYILPNAVFIYARIASYILCLTAMVWIWIKVKSPLKPFFIVASATFILFTALASYSNLYRGIEPKPFFHILPITAIKTAVLLDALIFAAALGYKMFIIEKEKRSHFQSYISQLEINKQLMTDMNEQLEKTVAERTAELEMQKEKQIRLEYDQKLAQLEMQALRSQMNPHFIFNSLNSIRYQIQTAQYKNASDYLVRFSKLLRLSLENSRRETVTLTEELALTKLYLEIEGQRFGDAYQFAIEVASDVDADEIELPPLLLQPYAENAIKHGLMNSNKPLKMVDIKVTAVSGGICIAISDNGVGRQASQQRHMEGGLEHKSLGMEITRERMQLFSKHEQVSLTAEIEDIIENGTIDGTRVIITCKNQHYV